MISTGVANKGDCRYIKSKTREFNTVKLFLNHGRLTGFYYKGLLSLNGESLLWLKFYLVFRYQHYTKNIVLVIQHILESRIISVQEPMILTAEFTRIIMQDVILWRSTYFGVVVWLRFWRVVGRQFLWFGGFIRMLLVTVPMHFYDLSGAKTCPNAESDPLPGSTIQTWTKQFHHFCRKSTTSVEVPQCQVEKTWGL